MVEPTVAVLADGLSKRYGRVTGARRLRSRGPRRLRLRSPRAERRRQDDGGPHPGDARAAGRWSRRGRRLRCRPPGGPRSARGSGSSASTPRSTRSLSGRQNLVMFGRLFHLRARRAGRRADELLERFGLADAGNKPVKRYSGGMRRRLDLAASLILAPAVLFLDEPTTGLDPRGRNEVWEAIRALVRDGTTVLLTTQYLDEADQLADRICVIDPGRVIADGSPDRAEAHRRWRSDRGRRPARRATCGRAAALVARIAAARPQVDLDTRRSARRSSDRVTLLVEALRAFEAAGIEVEDVALRQPTLDEAFLQLTGQRPTEARPPHECHQRRRQRQELAARRPAPAIPRPAPRACAGRSRTAWTLTLRGLSHWRRNPSRSSPAWRSWSCSSSCTRSCSAAR